MLLDPLEVPDEVEGISHVVLSNRHHKRSAFEARERFGATVHVPRVGLHEFADSGPVEPYDFGSPFAGGAITAHQVTELWPDDGALQIPSVNALAIADTVLRPRRARIHAGRLLRRPRRGAGEHPGRTRPPSAEVDFAHLLLAHGNPIAADGRERLKTFSR